MALAAPTVAVAGQNMPAQTANNNTNINSGGNTTGTQNGNFLPNGTYPSTGPGNGNYVVYGQTNGIGPGTAFGTSTTGQQPAGNNYPAGIYGVGGGGGGTALGTVTSDELTSNQLNGLISQNSPYIQQARNQATAQANSRGAINSSIAAGNAQGAAIQAALPIAADNANTIANLQTTNLNDLSKTQTANIGANAQMSSAAMAAGAEMNVASQNNAGALLRQTDQNAFQGEQDELAFEHAGALSQQAYQQNLGLDSFNLGSTLLTGQQNFYSQAGLAAMNDPAIMGDPASFGGYMQFVSGPFSNVIDSIFNNPIFGGIFGNQSGTSAPSTGSP